MDAKDFTLGSFLQVDWSYESERDDHNGYHSVTRQLQAWAEDKLGINAVEQAAILTLLARATSMMLEPESINDPFVPFRREIQGNRDTHTDDFTEDELNFFEEVTASIAEPWLAARVADILWLRRKNIKYAQMAMDAYISRDIAPNIWCRDIKNCWERAGRICLQVRDTNRKDALTRRLIDAFNLEYPELQFLRLWLAELMGTLKIDSTYLEHIAGLLLKDGKAFKEAGNHDTARSYLRLSSKKYDQSGNQSSSVGCLVLISESYEEEGNFQLAGSSMLANSSYRDAVHAYRNVPSLYREQYKVESKIQLLRAKVTKTGQATLGEMSQVKTKGHDISAMQKDANNHVAGKASVEQVIFDFAGVISGSKVEDINKRARSQIQNFPIQSMMSSQHMAIDGRVVAVVPGLNSNAGEDDPDNIRVFERFKYQEFSLISQLSVQARILPALNTLLLEHRVTRGLIESLCFQSPIVPARREKLLGHALWLGFEYDFASAIHLLSPQVEHIVRTQLKASGAITCQFKAGGIETENGLSSLLEMVEAKQVFGEDLVFELKAVFAEVLGSNLRNEVSHGLLDDESSHCSASIYAWWLVLRLVVRSFTAGVIQNEQEKLKSK